MFVQAITTFIMMSPAICQVAWADTADTVKQEETQLVETKDALLLVRSKNDTVLIVRQHDIDKVALRIADQLHKSRQHGYGGGGGFTPGFMLVDTKPIQDLFKYESEFRNKGFSVNRFEPVITTGGLGYGGIGNGIRIGGGGISGQLSLETTFGDSVALLDVDYGFGGVLLEKVLVRDRWNLFAGCMLGGGGYTVQYDKVKKDNASFFSATTTPENNGQSVSVGAGVLELHGGGTYTFLPWFHVGGQAHLATVYGSSFRSVRLNGGPGSFFSFSPGLMVRFIFGNLG
jgi:hypothetical protein